MNHIWDSRGTCVTVSLTGTADADHRIGSRSSYWGHLFPIYVRVHDMVVRVIESVVTKRTVQYNAPRVMMISLAWVKDKSAALVDMAFLCD